MENQTKVELTVEFESMEEMKEIFGILDENIHLIEKGTDTEIAAREGRAVISGNMQQAEMAKQVILKLCEQFRQQEYIDENKISYFLDLAGDGEMQSGLEAMQGVVAVTNRGRPIKCRTLGQRRYMEAIDHNTVNFAIGPAGTGKTYLAMAKAVVALKNKEISRIILTRPAVEAGELQSKVDPYLRPLYDALYEFMGAEAYQKLVETGVVEVAPLAYMRGRTLSDAFIILDEAQNASMAQMKMFLTRFGENSKVVVTGDVTQIDLPRDQQSGLRKTAEILKGIDGVSVTYLTNRDVVRHKLVKDIVKAFEKEEEREISRRG